jgi:hypothetical protein
MEEIRLNRVQLLAIRQLISKVELEEVVIRQVTQDELVLTLKDMEGNERLLAMDEYGQGRLR